MDQYLKDKEEIMKRFSEILDERYLNLTKTGNFSTTEIGKETGKMILEFNIKKKFIVEKKMNSLFGNSSSTARSTDSSLSVPLLEVSSSTASAASTARSSYEYLNTSRQTEFLDNDGSISYRSSKGTLKNMYNNFGTIFDM